MAWHVFLSGVSSEVGRGRTEIASDLRSKGLAVKEQQDFRQEVEADTLLDKLHNYIRDCQAVICLIGFRSGGFPPEKAAEPYIHLLPTGVTRASYTQWEFIFARHHRCRRSVYVATKEYVPDKDKPSTEDEDGESQRKFVEWIKRDLGRDRNDFSTPDGLRISVLRGDWPRVPKDKPNTLPYPSLGTLFKGRGPFMERLRESLRRTAADGRATAIVGRAIHGLGGVGKTQCAVEYGWAHEDEYSAVLFVSADTPEKLEANIAQLVGPLAIDLPANAPQPDQVAAALKWLDQHPGWFLIIDNLDTRQAVLAAEKLLAKLRGGHVVLTSRLTQWHQYVEPLELDVLDEADAKVLLLETTRGRTPTQTDDADAAELARELDGLALALGQAAAYVRRRRITFGGYLKEWRSHKPEVQDWHDPMSTPYPYSVAVTWETTLKQLQADEIALLRLLSFFAPDPIPMWVLEHEKAPRILKEAADRVTAEVAAASSNPARDWRDALAALADFSLVRWDNADPADQSIAVHRVLQEIIRTRLSLPQRTESLTDALRLLDAVRPYPSYDVRTWPQWNPLQPHVAFATSAADAAGIFEPTTALLNALGQLLNAKALHAQAEPLMVRALAIDEASFGKDHPNVAIRLNNLAQLLQVTNRLTEAEPLMRRALVIDEAGFGRDHPKVAIRLNNLAGLLQATNRLTEAEPLMRRALAIDEASFGKDHPNVARDLNNLAQLLQATNRLTEAEPLMRRALAINEASYGKDHPNVAMALNNLASLLQATNRLTEAEPLMLRALAIDEASFGKDHPNVARDLSNLAHLLHDTNQLNDAEPLMVRALAIDEAGYGKDHPNVAIRLNNLAALLQATNRLAEAEPLMRRHLEIFMAFTRSTAHPHPNLQAAINNYGSLLMKMGKTRDEAVAAVREICPEVFGR